MKNDLGLVSVIIPIYNQERFLKTCIDSILAQDYENFELILVDDGSTDSSNQICKEYCKKDSRISLITKKNAGVSAARNTGLKYASGNWTLFVDSDDWIASDLISDAAYQISSTGSAPDIYIFGIQEVKNNESPRIEDQTFSSVLIQSTEEIIGLQKRIFNRDSHAVVDRNRVKMPGPYKLFRSDIIKGIEFPETISNGEDGIFNLYVLERVTTVLVNETPKYFYRQHNESITHTYKEDYQSDMVKLMNEYEKFMSFTSHRSNFIESLKEKYLISFGFTCIFELCNPENKERYKERKKKFDLYFDQFYSSKISGVRLNSFLLKKKLFYCPIIHRSFPLVNLLGNVLYKTK